MFNLSHCAHWKLGSNRKAFGELKLYLDLTSSSQNTMVGKSVHFKWNHVNTKWCLYCRGLLKFTFLAKPELQKHALIVLYEETIIALWDIYIIYSLGSTKNNDFCHNSDCLQVSVSLGALPFTFKSVNEDLKFYASWLINKLCLGMIQCSFHAAKKKILLLVMYACLSL